MTRGRRQSGPSAMADAKDTKHGAQERRSDGDAGEPGSKAAPDAKQPRQKERAAMSGAPRKRSARRFAALDLGTNNCRLLIASPRGRDFRIIDAFSRIVRLGDGLSQTGRLSEAAMTRSIDALKVCAEKIERRAVTSGRYIATQACRSASNGAEFLARVEEETGLAFEVITTEEEARLAALGCADLVEPGAKACLIFDIGGGSTEVSFVRVDQGADRPLPDIVGWFSVPLGVVNLSEKYGGRDLSSSRYEEIVSEARAAVRAFGDVAGMRRTFNDGEGHFLGTSGTVTSLAGVHLGLDRYRRDAVDGLWMTADETRRVTDGLRDLSYEARVREPCIGRERADLVLCGCAILEALLREWPTDRIRVADRGLREGLLHELASAARRRSRGGRRRR